MKNDDEIKDEGRPVPHHGSGGGEVPPIPSVPKVLRRYDHAFEPGAYGVCRRCGGERH